MKANHIIQELIFNIIISNEGCFLSLYLRNEFATDGSTTLNRPKEFGSFLEYDTIYLNTENDEI